MEDLPFVQRYLSFKALESKTKKKKNQENLKVYSNRNLKSGFLNCLILIVFIMEQVKNADKQSFLFFFLL